MTTLSVQAQKAYYKSHTFSSQFNQKKEQALNGAHTLFNAAVIAGVIYCALTFFLPQQSTPAQAQTSAVSTQRTPAEVQTQIDRNNAARSLEARNEQIELEAAKLQAELQSNKEAIHNLK